MGVVYTLHPKTFSWTHNVSPYNPHYHHISSYACVVRAKRVNHDQESSLSLSVETETVGVTVTRYCENYSETWHTLLSEGQP